MIISYWKVHTLWKFTNKIRHFSGWLNEDVYVILSAQRHEVGGECELSTCGSIGERTPFVSGPLLRTEMVSFTSTYMVRAKEIRRNEFPRSADYWSNEIHGGPSMREIKSNSFLFK